jgi:hypothetical protein
MPILFRNTAVLTIGGMETRLTVYVQDELLRVELTPYSSNPLEAYTGTLSAAVTYGAQAKQLAASPFTKTVSAVFDEDRAQKSITLSSSSAIVYDGKASAPLTVSWKGDGTLAVPSARITYASGLLIGAPSGVRWTVDGIPEGYAVRTLGVWMYRAPRSQIEPQYTRSCLLDRKSADFSLEHTLSDLAERNILFYRIALGLYPAGSADSAGRDDYELYFELDSPPYVCTGDLVYTLAPYNFRCSGVRRNRVVNLTWETLPTALQTQGFRLDVTFDGGTWHRLFWDVCTSKSYSYAIPQGQRKVAFRLCAYSTRSKYELSSDIYTPWVEVGTSNVYVGYHGSAVPAAEVHIGSLAASAALSVG